MTSRRYRLSQGILAASVAVCLAVTTTPAATARQDRPTPVFRSMVDLVAVDVQVVNGTGPNEVDVNSNTISGGGNPLLSCSSAALVIASGTPDGGVAPAVVGKGIFRNNILRGGDCTTRYGVWELDAGADPRVFENNDLDPTAGSGSLVIYLDEGGNNVNLITSINGAADMTASGNINADPYLANYVAFDWHLDAGSPCIGAGTSAGAPAVDIDGQARDALPDIGADEFQ